MGLGAGTELLLLGLLVVSVALALSGLWRLVGWFLVLLPALLWRLVVGLGGFLLGVGVPVRGLGMLLGVPRGHP